MYDIEMVAKILVQEKDYSVAKTEKGNIHYFNIMTGRYLMMGWELKGNMIVIDSLVRALHSSTNTKDSGIVLLWVLVLLLVLVF